MVVRLFVFLAEREYFPCLDVFLYRSILQVAHAQRHSAKYNLVSAAVATCLMAFVLSGCAVVAARIRKRKENITDYAQLPEGQE